MKATFIFLLFLVLRTTSFSQGKVVINEYMPWTPSSCGPTADFVELLNFGPGPMNIGCYILTDGDYSITIPANTILQPGQFFLISGQDILPSPCGNIDSLVHVQLNWNTCNCTSGAIPTTGDGLFTDGGSANEQVVLLDPSLNVVDALVRSLPVEPSALITTSAVSGQCTPRTFDLDLMSINYETIGESTGRGNSFARKLDGDCGWVKDPQQSAHATNNTPGEASDVQYSFNYTKSQACPNDGSVTVTVTASSYVDVFPMSYTLAFDTDADGVFETSDSYTNGTVNNPNTITIGNLVEGTYRLTVASAKGCFLNTFPFTILNCFAVLPIRLISFDVQQNNNRIECSWSIEHPEDLKYVTVERSMDGISFSSFSTIQTPAHSREVWNYNYSLTESNNTMPFFRLHMYSHDGKESFSAVVNSSSRGFAINRVWPNPVKNILYAESSFVSAGVVEYQVFNMSNKLIAKANKNVHRGINSITIPVQHLSPDIYQLILQDKNHPEATVRLRFVKL